MDWIIFPQAKKNNLEEVKSLVNEQNNGRASNLFKAIFETLMLARKHVKALNISFMRRHSARCPARLEDPINTNENNITGMLNMLVAARD